MNAPAATRVQHRARTVVSELANRLADPAAIPPGRAALSLAAGHPGIALLFAELARTGPESEQSAHRRSCHAHLAAATRQLRIGPEDGLFQGVPSLLLAAHLARHTDDDYAALLERLDPLLCERSQQVIDAEQERLDEAVTGPPMRSYDLVSGATGLGRLLLLRRRPDAPPGPLEPLLGCLVRLAEPLTVHGRPVPGWWVPHSSGPEAQREGSRGHFNLGLAHGIAGPLALLAAAHRAGVRVPGQREAIAAMGGWLLSWQRRDDRSFPAVIPFDDYLSGPRGGRPPHSGRTAWCYGTPGTAAALYQAGAATGRVDWCGTAVDALCGALRRPRGFTGPGRHGICHGWAGLLHLTARLAHASGDPRLVTPMPQLAARLIDDHRAGLTLGAGPGLLEGAAGVALALQTYASGTVPASGWDAALLTEAVPDT